MSQYSKKFFRYLNKTDSDQSDNFFIGIVREVVSEDKEHVYSSLSTDEYKDIIDNRNIVYITPAHSNLNVVEPAFFINSHNIDLPLLGEAVFCIRTPMGNFIIDRFSINQFSLNYDSYEYLLGGIFSNKDIEFEYPESYEDKFNKETIEHVKPFKPNEGAKYFIGRNNQYIIFDHGSRKESSSIEEEQTKEGNYLKLGIRKKGNQADSREDSTLMIMAENTSLNHLLTETYQSTLKEKHNNESENGIGMQADHILCVGRRFTVVFSLKDILIEAKETLYLKAKNIEVNSDLTKIISDRILLGSNHNQSYVRGEDLLSALKEIISLIRNARYLVSTGGSTISADPSFSANLQNFESRFLNRNSPILSKKIKGE